MKAKDILFKLFALLAIAVLLTWKFWPAQNSAPVVGAATDPTALKTLSPPVVVSRAVVEAPVVPPAPVSSTSNGPLLIDNGSSLYDASKARAALSNSAGTGDDDYNAIVKGSPELAKLGNTLAQTAALTQSLGPVDSFTKLPTVVTDLGKIALMENQPEIRKLASGDEAILTLLALPAGSPVSGYSFRVLANFLYPNANGSFDDPGLQGGTLVQSGHGAVIRDFATGNEIHFVPEFTDSAVPSP